MGNREKAMAHLRVIYAYTAFARKRGTCYLGLQAMCDIEERASDALALLEEQDAVKPKSKSRHGANAQIQHFCGNCNSMLHGKPKYCSECGKGVKWE